MASGGVIFTTVHKFAEAEGQFPLLTDRKNVVVIADEAHRSQYGFYARKVPIKKIDSTMELIDQDDYGYCEACGIDIGIQRLEARPTATQCIDCKTLAEIKERQEMG